MREIWRDMTTRPGRCIRPYNATMQKQSAAQHALIFHMSRWRIYIHPSHLPKRRNSSRLHFRLTFSETLFVLADESLLFNDEVKNSLSFPFLLAIACAGVVATVGCPRIVLAALILGAAGAGCVLVCRGEGRGGVDDSAPVRTEPLGGDAEMGPGPAPAGVRVCRGTAIGVATADGAEAFAADFALADSWVTSTGEAVVESDDEEVGTESRYQHPE